MNRNRGANKFTTNHKKNVFNDAYSDPFRGFDPSGLEKIKKGTFMDEKAVTNDEMDEIKTAFMNHLLPPIKFDGNNTTVLKHTIDPNELYDEFVVALKFGQCGFENTHKQITILHQIPDDSTYYKKLFQWSKYGEVMENFFMAIHYQIYCKREYNPILIENQHNNNSNNNNNNNNNNSDDGTTNTNLIANLRNINQVDVRMKEFQDNIIASHFNKRYLLPRELLRCIEHGSIDVTLQKLILHQSIAMFLFQWSEPTPYSFVLGFTIDFDDARVTHFLSSKVIHLSRKELVEWNEPSGDEKKKLESIEWVENDVVTTDNALDLYVLNMSILRKSLQSTFISYITLAYVRRDGD